MDIMPLQLSRAVAVPLPVADGDLSAASQEIVAVAGQVMTGPVTSCTLIVCVQVLVLLAASRAVQVRVIV
jgi:hypothetical protein